MFHVFFFFFLLWKVRGCRLSLFWFHCCLGGESWQVDCRTVNLWTASNCRVEVLISVVLIVCVWACFRLWSGSVPIFFFFFFFSNSYTWNLSVSLMVALPDDPTSLNPETNLLDFVTTPFIILIRFQPAHSLSLLYYHYKELKICTSHLFIKRLQRAVWKHFVPLGNSNNSNFTTWWLRHATETSI